MSRENSNVSFRLSSSQSSLDSGVSNRNEDETSSIVSSKTFETECVSKIIKILDLDDSTDSENLARQLMIKGRQVLRDHQRDVSKKIFEKQMNTNQSELLDILKAYVEHQWKETISEQWFHQFLGRQPPAIYNQVVARTAEYGSTYIKDNRLLSLTIQFLFQYDNEKMSKDNLFDKIWNTLISEGRHGIQHYKDDLATKLLKEQLENNESPLYLALKDYYRAPLQKFFNQKEINIHNDETFQITLDSVADRGWSLGLKHTEVADSIALNKLDILVEEAKKYLASKLLPIPDQPPSSDNNAGGTSALINTAANVTSPVTDKIEAVTSNTSSNSGNSTDHVFPTTTTTTIMPNADDIRRQERIQECKMITMCINDYEKLQLSNLVEAGELMYIDQKLDCHLDKIVKDYSLKQNFSSFIQACLIPTMYLLKRHQNFDDFIESLFFKYSQVESPSNAPKLCLRMFIHVLLLNSDLSLSRKIMSLLSKRNPVPFLHPSLSEDRTSYQFVSDIFHVWDYSIPTLLSFGIGPSEGKSTLINTIFLSSFELSMSSIYFQNTIDIDFGYSFLPRRSTNIADCHGPMVKTLLEKIHELFDGFLIHVEYSYLMNNIDSIHDLLNVIMRNNPYHLLIVRDAPTDQHEQCSNFLSSQLPSIKTFLLPNIADQKNQKNKHSIIVLRNAIWENIPTRCRRDMSYLKNEFKLLMNREYKQHLDQMYTTIVPLERTLLQTATDERAVQRCFPEYLKFVELCELKLKLARFNFYGNDKDAVVYDVRRKIFDLENASNVTDVHGSSIIYELFSNVLNASNMLTCMELLADELKQERASIVSNADMATQLPIQKSLSLEVLWRNAIVCSQYEPEDVQKKLQRQYYQYIQAGFPFEIVDGDNFYLPYSFLFNALEPFRNRRTLVISVIGPQNSGKSTLLNYMFGTLFDVRDGRCTRGIYGSFVKTNRSDFEYIMLIDTEGLLGIEREDSEYDRRIVLFCLAVSHLVIVNMVGEVSTTLQSMLTLCADSLEKMGVTKIPQPIVHYILNQKADLNIENHQAAIDRIITDVKKFGLGNSIDIGKGTFHTLPSAFKKDGQTSTSNLKLPNVVKTAPEFIECVQSLSGEIIRSAEPCLHRANEFFDPLQWLSSSRTIFDTLQKFSDLTYYNDIHERRLDNEIREHIRNDLTKIFSTDYRDKLILESSLKSEQEIIGLFLVKQNQIQETARQNVQDLFKLLKAPDKLRERSEQFLKVQITEMFNALRTSTIAVNEREKVKLIVQNGEGGLQKLVEDTIQSGLQMSPDVASQQFDEMFNNTIRSIETQFVPRIRLEQAIKHIYTNYNIYEKEYLLEAGHITIHLSLLSNWNDSKASIAQVQDELIIRFTQLGYQDSSVAVHHFNPTTRYSRDIIKNLIYLSEDLLDQEFLDYVNQPSPSIDNHQRKDGDRHHNKNFIQRGINYVASALNGSRDDRQVQQPTVFSTDQFQLTIRDKIRNQKPPISQGTPDERNMCFGTSKVFTEVIARIIKTMEGVGNDPVRQIRTELIQKIVGLINSLIIEIDNELAPFCLSLSRPLKSTFHACAIILLTKYYYDEQINQFNQTLSALQTKKNDLKQYFINMVVPNAAVDENYAVNLGKQFKEHLLKLFVVEGQQIINTELGKLTYLNRKWIQDRCDGQLLTRKDDLWHLDYIENPTKIIEQFFKELWSNVEKDIDQKLADRKSHYVRLLTEFFFCIRGKLTLY
jgi:hypothetical protein